MTSLLHFAVPVTTGTGILNSLMSNMRENDNSLNNHEFENFRIIYIEYNHEFENVRIIYIEYNPA